MKTTLVTKVLNSLVEEHLTAMQVRHYSASTLRTRRFLLRGFADWCGTANIRLSVQFRKRDIEEYQAHLYQYRKHSSQKTAGQPLSVRGQQMRLSAVSVFLGWLTKTGVLASNPATDLEGLREEHRLPRQVLTATEAEKILNAINTQWLTGVRDRAMLETLYSTGMRRGELLALTLDDIQRESGVVRINCGKGSRDRVVPVGARALAWIERYLQEVRPRWIQPTSGPHLFLTNRGTRLSANQASQVAKRHIDNAQVGKKGSCHIFRHTCATVLLQNGADIRSIQQLLGHASLETTQLYTQVTVVDLKRVHSRCHPLAQMPTGCAVSGRPIAAERNASAPIPNVASA